MPSTPIIAASAAGIQSGSLNTTSSHQPVHWHCSLSPGADKRYTSHCSRPSFHLLPAVRIRVRYWISTRPREANGEARYKLVHQHLKMYVASATGLSVVFDESDTVGLLSFPLIDVRAMRSRFYACWTTHVNKR